MCPGLQQHTGPHRRPGLLLRATALHSLGRPIRRMPLRYHGTRALTLAGMLAGLFVAPALSAQQSSEVGPNPAGSWEGSMEIPPVPQEVTVVLREGGEGWEGHLSLPMEQIHEMPFQAVELDGDALTLHLTPSRFFSGRIEGDVMEGEFRIEEGEGVTFPTALYRVGSEPWVAFLEDWEAGVEERKELLAEHRPPPLQRTERGPASRDVNTVALSHLVESARETHSTGLVVLQGGEVVEQWHAGGEPRAIEAMSVTKSVLNLAVGRLLRLGLLDSLDTPVHEFYPQWSEGPHAEITIRHLMAHTSGLESPMPTDPIYASGDFVRFALESPVVSEPGTEFVYNNNATNLLAGLIGVAAMQRADFFVLEEIFEPMGITQVGWSLDGAGNPHGMAGLQIRPDDLARLGQLALQEGVWEGQRLIDASWFQESFAQASAHAESGGLLWWLLREDEEIVGVRADGYLGQYLVIYPEEELVGVRMIQSFPGYDPVRDGFEDFPGLLLRLAR
jgi:CubicO group peptidase (beta-lactamase class C family)